MAAGEDHAQLVVLQRGLIEVDVVARGLMREIGSTGGGHAVVPEPVERLAPRGRGEPGARTVVAASDFSPLAPSQTPAWRISSLSSPQRLISASNSGVPSCVLSSGPCSNADAWLLRAGQVDALAASERGGAVALLAIFESRAPTRCDTRFAVDAGFGTMRSRVPRG